MTNAIGRAGIVTALAALLGAGLAAPSAVAVPPGPPTSPQVSQPDVTTTILSWTAPAGAQRFEVVIDNSADFSSPLITQTTTNQSYVPATVLPSGDLSWRVRAINAGNESSDWTYGSFAQGRVATPQPATPAPGSTITAATPPLLTWGLIGGATDYKVELSRENSFTPATTKAFSTQSTSLVPPQTLEKGTWYWRVTASRGAGLVSDPSAAWSFDVAPLATPTLLAPPNSGAVPVEDVVLKWAPVPGTRSYEIDISRDKDFPGAGEGFKNGPDWVTHPRVSTVGTNYSPGITLDNAVTWYWRVRTVDFNGSTSDWQQNPFVFRRAWGDTSDGVDGTTDLRDIPTLDHPAAAGTETIDGPFSFSWRAAQHASDYEINVGTDSLFSPGTFTRCRVHGTTYTPYQFRLNVITGATSRQVDDQCVPSPGRTNYWRVRGLDRPFSKTGVLPGVQGEFSAAQAFKWEPTAIMNLQPLNQADVPTPTIRWDAVTGAETYKVRITDSNGATVQAETHSTSYTMTNRLYTIRNPYTWTVEALDAAKNPVSAVYASPAQSFDIVPAAGQASWQNLTASGSTLRAPDLRWAPITDAASYRVWVRRDGDGWLPASSQNLLTASLGSAAMTDISDDLFAAGQYRWMVRAYDTNGAQIGAASPEWVFTIAPLGSVTGQEAALDGTTLGTAESCDLRLDAGGTDGPRCNPMPSTPVVSWDKVPGASLYQVWVATDASFTTPMEPESRFSATSNTMYAPNLSSQVSAYPDNDTGNPTSAYYWAIVACKSTTSCGSTLRGQLGYATNAFVKKSPAVELVSPAADTEVVGSNVTFTWKDYLATNSALIEKSKTITGEPSPQSAMLYRFQIAMDSNFQDIRESVVVDQTTYTSPHQLFSAGPLYWRVRAIDGDANELTWSEVRRVTKKNPVPQLTQPADGSQVSPTTILRWQPMSAVNGYRVEVYKNNQVSPANLVCSTANSDARYAALACPKPLAPNGSGENDQYRWRVQRVDASTLANAWSQEQTFRVSPAALQVLSPVSGAGAAPNGAVLNWTVAPGAASYRIDLRNESTGQNLTSVTTIASAYAVPSNLTTGTYRWTVTAFDSAGGAMATTSSTFVVDAAVRAVTATAIAAPGGSVVGQTVIGTPPTWSQPGVINNFQWLRNGSPISGETGTTYTLTTADYTRTVSLRVIGTKPGYTDGVSISNEIAVTAGGALQNVGVPTISGSATPGGSLSVTTGSWSPAATRLRYQWNRTGVPIPNATAASYRVTADDAGKDLSVTVFGSASGFNEGATTTAAVAVARLKSTATGVLKMSRVKVGKRAKLTITVSVAGLGAPTGVVQVLDKGKKIGQFTLAPVHQGKKTLKLRKLPKGKHPLKVVYLGNGQTFGSRSKKIVLYIVK